MTIHPYIAESFPLIFRHTLPQTTIFEKVSAERVQNSPWSIAGFLIDPADIDDRVRRVLTRKYEHTAVQRGMKAKIEANLAMLFHYVYFFRALSAHEQDVLVFGAADLNMDPKVLEQVYHWYRQARQDFETGMNDGIPDGADEMDSLLCGVVDRVITMRTGQEMTDEELEEKSKALREEWRAIMAEFNEKSDRKTPFFPVLNELLMEIIETVEEKRQEVSRNGEECEGNGEEEISNDQTVSGGFELSDGHLQNIEAYDDATLEALAVHVVKEVGRRCDTRRQDPTISSSERFWYWVGVAETERFLGWAGKSTSH